MKKFSFAWLLIVPAIVFTFNFFFVKNQDRFYMNWTDSSYAYLYNGMNLANGKMEIGHTDNPGTTVQMAAGVLIKIIHVVSGKNPVLVDDVLTDPEKYLHILSFIFIVSSCLILFYLGCVIRRWSNNTRLAIFIQSGILVSFPSLTCMADIRSEPLLIMGGSLYAAICFSFIHEKEMTQKKMFRYSIKFAAICAFLIITKMTAAPVAILPFFLLRKWKSYFVYAVALPVFTTLFFFPALPKTQLFFHWVKDLFFHSGFYGQGKKNIIDFATAKDNLIYMSHDIPFVICCSVMFAAMLILLLRGQLKLNLWKENINIRLLTGIFTVTLILILIVTKQFQYHYLIPADSLMMLGTYLSLRLAFPSESALFALLRNLKVQVAGISLIIILCSFNDFHLYNFYKNLKDPRLETASVMAKYKNVPRLYMTVEYYFAELPPAMYYGSVYAGNERFDYYKRLEKFYPQAYFYEIPLKTFHKWGATFDYEEFLKHNKQALVCFYYTDSTLVEQSLTDLRRVNRENKVVELKKVYVNPLTGEQLYELNRVGEIKDVPDSAVVISCDAEKIIGGSLVSTNEGYNFQGIQARTQKEFHGGNAALELTKNFQFGFSLDLDVKPNQHYEITAWRKSADGFGVVVATDKNAEFYQSSSSVVEQGENGWEKISLKFDIPPDYSKKAITVYAWNQDRDESVYFDDFRISCY